MFEQSFKNVDNVLRKDAGCGSELDYVQQSSWILFLKHLDDLEEEKEISGELSGKPYERIISKEFSWKTWAMPKNDEGKLDHHNALKGDEQKCLDAGCNAYLAKPLDMEKLFDTLRCYLRPSSEDRSHSAVDQGEVHGDERNAQGVSHNTQDVPSERVDESTRSPDAEDVISWTRLVQYMDDDEELIRDVVEAWVVQNPGEMAALGEAVTAQDAERIYSLAHMLKGSAGAIAAGPMTEKASRLETAGRGGGNGRS